MIDAFLNNPFLFFGTLGLGGAALVYAAYRFGGWRFALAALAALGAATALRNARKGGYEAGKQNTEQQYQEKSDDLKEQFREIESDDRSVDTALDGLRARAATRRQRSVPKPSAPNRKSR
jgi:hypothetical protein